jgi:hypothetical protein
VKLNKKVSPEVISAISQIEGFSKLADTVASHLGREDRRQAGRACHDFRR